MPCCGLGHRRRAQLQYVSVWLRCWFITRVRGVCVPKPTVARMCGLMWFIIVSWWVRLYELFRDDLCRPYFKTCRTLLKMSVLLQSTTQNGQWTPASFLPQRWSLFPARSLSSTGLECCRIWLIYFSGSGLTVFCRALFLPLMLPDTINLLFHIYSRTDRQRPQVVMLLNTYSSHCRHMRV